MINVKYNLAEYIQNLDDRKGTYVVSSKDLSLYEPIKEYYKNKEAENDSQGKTDTGLEEQE
jgi:hypothetical protein